MYGNRGQKGQADLVARPKHTGQPRDFWAVKDLDTKKYACYSYSRPMFFVYEDSARRWADNRNDLCGYDKYIAVRVRLVEVKSGKQREE